MGELLIFIHALVYFKIKTVSVFETLECMQILISFVIKWFVICENAL